MLKTMFKFLVLMLILVISINIASVQSVAYITFSDIITTSDGYTFNTQTGMITGYSGNGGDIEIPSQINDIKVIGLDTGAFYNRTNLKNVTIPDSITSLGYGVFASCDLTSLTISKTPKDFFKSDEGGPFADCNIKNIILEDGTTSIEDFEFALITSLPTINTLAFTSEVHENFQQNVNMHLWAAFWMEPIRTYMEHL
ncbi:leucine-rich repeat protein [Pseudobacteroides cellulosolvens]|uniref:Leucine rich repeat 5 n=1 Tax=Pseudobacteroides cellulosolvens ATCC 35603 = DSM 2933 TaxID=398512 RepID=A0A0L6JJT1_9FIRM|nr:leucine-rich repeat domain-containing protein [Pseudobacteroides cellulosolvens]KNY26019.1 Leucine rich repeat 5 [Pseudobacteroides cellulosolvens ATCC 35603 = DSM 2933]